VPGPEGARPGPQEKTLEAVERDREDVAEAGRAWRDELAAIDPARLVLVDETGIGTRMTRACARAGRGERAVGKVPWGRWERLTVIGALGPGGLERSARKLGCLYPHERAEVSMAGSYSTDLRERVLAAVGAGATPEAAARRFAVGRSTAYRWATAARLEGRRAAKRMGGGPKPRITGEVEAALLDLLREANHLTLAECRDRLAERTGVRVHPWTVGRALRRCGWT